MRTSTAGRRVTSSCAGWVFVVCLGCAGRSELVGESDASANDASDWPTLGSDPQHSGFNPDETAVPPPAREWSAVVLAGTPLTPAVVENGQAFVASVGPYPGPNAPLVAVDATDGSLIWSHDFGSVVSLYSLGQPSASNGRVYVQTNAERSSLWSLDAATGAVQWAAPFQSTMAHYWAPTSYGGTVYIGGGAYGGIYAFSAADGAEIFFNGSVGSGSVFDAWSPAYFSGAVYTFVGSAIQAFDPRTGVEVWSAPVQWNSPNGASMDTFPVFGTTLGYVVSPPSLLAFDPSSHTVSWTIDADYSGAPAVAGSMVYGISAGTLVAREAATGLELWEFQGDRNLSYPPALTNDTIYVSSNSNVYAVNRATGEQVWTEGVGGWVTVGAGCLLVAGSDGTLRGFVLSRPSAP